MRALCFSHSLKRHEEDRYRKETPALPCNIVFVKQPKVGGSTVGGICRRIAAHRHLHGVFNDKFPSPEAEPGVWVCCLLFLLGDLDPASQVNQDPVLVVLSESVLILICANMGGVGVQQKLLRTSNFEPIKRCCCSHNQFACRVCLQADHRHLTKLETRIARLRKPYLMITWLRDPLTRCMSNYYFWTGKNHTVQAPQTDQQVRTYTRVLYTRSLLAGIATEV